MGQDMCKYQLFPLTLFGYQAVTEKFDTGQRKHNDNIDTVTKGLQTAPNKFEKMFFINPQVDPNRYPDGDDWFDLHPSVCYSILF